MKKAIHVLKYAVHFLLLGILILISTMLTGCETEHTHSEYDVENYLETLTTDQAELFETVQFLQGEIDHLNAKLNEQNVKYLELEKMFNQVLQETSYTYGTDENGNYITFEQLGNRLIAKYFGTYALPSDGMYYRNDRIELRIKLSSDYLVTNDINDLIARLTLLTNEFGDYSLYNQVQNSYTVSVQIIDSSIVESVQITFDTSLFNYIELTPTHIIDQYYEISFLSSFSQPIIVLVEQKLQKDYGDPVLSMNE